jgi:hypothetical protein
MSAEIALLTTPVPVAILGVNGALQEAGNDLMCAGRTLPWLEDDGVHDVWELWHVNYRDVVVLDAQGRVTAVYNLSTHDLANPVYYAELRALLLAAAGP